MSLRAKAAFRTLVPNRIWYRAYGVRYGGMDLEARTTVLRLAAGDLFVHSPCPLDAGLQHQVDQLGPVAHVVAPGNFHYLNVAAWMEAYPGASLWLCPGLREKCPELPEGEQLSDEAPAAWREELEQVVIRGNRVIREVLFFDRQSRTLIATDSVENYGDGTPNVPLLLKLWWRVFGLWNRPALAPEYGLGWRDRRAARESFERALKWDFERIMLSHGDLIDGDAHALAARAWRRLLECRK
jgi:hypothetical protein